jgi:hypothetical protein
VNPDKVQARKMVLAGLLVLTLVTVYKDRRSSDPAGTFRVFWGVGVVGMFLSLLADFLPQIAGPFAMLIALGSITNGGEQVLVNVLGTISPRPAAPAGSSSSSSSPPGPGSSSSPSPATSGPAVKTTLPNG